MFQQEFFAYILDTKKAISLKAYVSIPIMSVHSHQYRFMA